MQAADIYNIYNIYKQIRHVRIQEFSSGGGVQVSLTKKAITTFVFVVFLVLSLFYRSQMVNFKEIYDFSRFQRGVQLFPGRGPIVYSL